MTTLTSRPDSNLHREQGHLGNSFHALLVYPLPHASHLGQGSTTSREGFPSHLPPPSTTN
jgi:hypothetical protein